MIQLLTSHAVDIDFLAIQNEFATPGADITAIRHEEIHA